MLTELKILENSSLIFVSAVDENYEFTSFGYFLTFEED